MPPAPDKDQQVRSLLKVLGDYNRAIIGCALPLETLEGNNDSPGPAALLDLYIFTICDNSYAGTMTKEHYSYLKNSTSDLCVFARRLIKLLGWMNRRVVAAIKNLDNSLGHPVKTSNPNRRSNANRPNVAKAANTIPVPATGCCTISPTEQEDTSQSFCTLKLAGTWNPQPCSTKGKS